MTTDKNILIEENEILKATITKMETRLRNFQAWMEKEVKEQTRKIAKQKASKMTSSDREVFLNENIEEIISNRINEYFGELLLLNAPKWTIEGLTTAEINFHSMLKNPSIDGFAVISAYHKILDLFLESFITNNFRKYAKKKWQTILRVNDPLEKSLNLIVNSRYILSVGRLYGLLKLIKENKTLYDYGKCFRDYLNKYPELRDTLLDEDFFSKFSYINRSEVLSSKRHSWTITKKETSEARRILIGDFKDKKSMIYKLLETQTVLY